METILLPDFTTRRSVAVSSLEYFEAMGNYTLVHVSNRKPMLVAIPLKRFAERFPTFLRLHKGVLVNPAYIVAFHHRSLETPFVQLSEDRKLPISRRQLKQLKPRLAAYSVNAPVRDTPARAI